MKRAYTDSAHSADCFHRRHRNISRAQNYGSNEDESPLGSAVIVGPGKDATNLVFRYYPSASISGKVLDDAGEPVENALVQLVRSSVLAGRRVIATFRYVRTNDLGEYLLGWIPASAGYYITITGATINVKHGAPSGSKGLVNVDVALHPAASVSGTLKILHPGTPTGTIVVALSRAGAAATYTTTVKPDGSFRFPNLLLGKYLVSLRSSAGYYATNADSIDVADGESVSLPIVASDDTGSIGGYVKSGDKPIAAVLAVLAP